jgi:hypothetical protein
MKNNGIADFIKPTIITAQQYGTKVSVEIDHSDTDIDELFEAFKTICVGLGYHDSSWKNWIVDRADEYKEEAAEEAMYEPSPILRKVAEAYNTLLSEQDIAEKRMDIIGQNGNEGLHYDIDTDDDDYYDDYGQRIEPNEALKSAAKKYKKAINKIKKK